MLSSQAFPHLVDLVGRHDEGGVWSKGECLWHAGGSPGGLGEGDWEGREEENATAPEHQKYLLAVVPMYGGAHAGSKRLQPHLSLHPHIP